MADSGFTPVTLRSPGEDHGRRTLGLRTRRPTWVERPRSDDVLLADVVARRARLPAYSTSATEALADELFYDGALIRLCESRDVPTDPERFLSPPPSMPTWNTRFAWRGYPVTDR